ERILVDRPLEQRLGAAGLVVLPGDVAEVRDRGTVLHAFPDAGGFVVTAAFVEHRALVEARLDQAGVVVGDALERVGDPAVLGARDAAVALGLGVALHRLLEVGAGVGADVALLLLGDD